MNIIFKSNLTGIDNKYTVLDLDTFRLPDGTEHTACCVIENIPITELPNTEHLKTVHANLIESYGQRRWDQCEQYIIELTGKWGGDLDSFYSTLKQRIDTLKTQDLGPDWSPVILKQ
jgi:hypothetical protein